MTHTLIHALSAPISQAEFGAMVGISQPAVSGLMQRDVIARAGTAGEWLSAYCAHLVDIAEGRASAGTLDLVQERALLARAQREAQDMRNDTMRAEFAPVEILADCLAVVSDEIGACIDRLQASVQAQVPDLPQPALEAVTQVIRSAGTAWRGSTAELRLANDVTQLVDELEVIETAAAD